MQERRKEGRSPAYLGGQITTSRRLTTIDCVVRNTSGAGARLLLPNTTLLPETFELHIPRKNSAYRVKARWRRLEDVGVEIVPFDASDAPIPITLARRIRRLEQENAGLRKRLTESD
ncbi:MAG TPA: PilZ domain-containing protein [Xanthobacteraceae bacterium]|nr:PilZ domain-containing protein [Xanthobacteraceae bacterium]